MSRNTPAQLARLTKSNLDEAAQQQLPKIPARVSATRKKIREISNSLSQPSAEFEPSETLEMICDLLHSKQYLSRILFPWPGLLYLYGTTSGTGKQAPKTHNVSVKSLAVLPV